MLKLLATQPELLAEHVAAYAELASAEAAEATAALKQRTALGVIAALLALLGLIFGGVALLLLAALPLPDMPRPWLLAVVPALPLAGAIGCWLALRQRPTSQNFVQLRQQVATDTALLREALAS